MGLTASEMTKSDIQSLKNGVICGIDNSCKKCYYRGN